MLSIIFDAKAPLISLNSPSLKATAAATNASLLSLSIHDTSEKGSKSSSEIAHKASQVQLSNAAVGQSSVTKSPKTFYRVINLVHTIDSQVLWKLQIHSIDLHSKSIPLPFVFDPEACTINASKVKVPESHWGSQIATTMHLYRSVIVCKDFLSNPLKHPSRLLCLNFLSEVRKKKVQECEKAIEILKEEVSRYQKTKNALLVDSNSCQDSYSKNMILEIETMLTQLDSYLQKHAKDLFKVECELTQIDNLIDNALPIPDFVRIEIEQAIDQSLNFEEYRIDTINQRITNCEAFIKDKTLQSMVKCLSFRVVNLPELNQIPAFKATVLIPSGCKNFIPLVESIKEGLLYQYAFDDAGTQIACAFEDCHLADAAVFIKGQRVDSSSSEWGQWYLNLETAVEGDKLRQSFKPESFVMVGDHSQIVKAVTTTSNSSLNDYVNLSPSTAVSSLNCNATKASYHAINVLLFKGTKKAISENLSSNSVTARSVKVLDRNKKADDRGRCVFTPNSALFIRISVVFCQNVDAPNTNELAELNRVEELEKTYIKSLQS